MSGWGYAVVPGLLLVFGALYWGVRDRWIMRLPGASRLWLRSVRQECQDRSIDMQVYVEWRDWWMWLGDMIAVARRFHRLDSRQQAEFVAQLWGFVDKPAPGALTDPSHVGLNTIDFDQWDQRRLVNELKILWRDTRPWLVKRPTPIPTRSVALGR